MNAPKTKRQEEFEGVPARGRLAAWRTPDYLGIIGFPFLPSKIRLLGLGVVLGFLVIVFAVPIKPFDEPMKDLPNPFWRWLILIGAGLIVYAVVVYRWCMKGIRRILVEERREMEILSWDGPIAKFATADVTKFAAVLAPKKARSLIFIVKNAPDVVYLDLRLATEAEVSFLATVISKEIGKNCDRISKK